ncbi:MAG: winged helix-turn-helix domain-containing protein [archaeon]|nr:winged helix-turn-helix domain-containing protein [archaeon]
MAEQILEDFPIENLVSYAGKEGSRFRITKLSELNLESEGPSSKGLARSTQRIQFGRRSRVESYCDVFDAIGSGLEKPTHIMYKANLSWNVLEAHIEKLVRKGPGYCRKRKPKEVSFFRKRTQSSQNNSCYSGKNWI